MEANLVVVHEFGTKMEADIAKGALESAGIDSMIQADTAGGMRPHLAWAGSGYKLLVRQEDEETGHEILDAPAER